MHRAWASISVAAGELAGVDPWHSEALLRGPISGQEFSVSQRVPCRVFLLALRPRWARASLCLLKKHIIVRDSFSSGLDLGLKVMVLSLGFLAYI